MLNLTSNERRSILGEFIGVTVVNPRLQRPARRQDVRRLQGTAHCGWTHDPRQQLRDAGERLSCRSASRSRSRRCMRCRSTTCTARARFEPMTPSINFFEDPVTHPCRAVPPIYGRPYPQYTNITMTTSTGKSEVRRPPARAQPAQRPFDAWRQLHAVAHARQPQRQPRRDADQLVSTWMTSTPTPAPISATGSSSTPSPRCRSDIQASAIYFAGSPRVINVSTSLDPFGLGYTGRWLESQCPCSGRHRGARQPANHRLRQEARRARVEGDQGPGARQAAGCPRRVQSPEHEERHQLRDERVLEDPYLQPASSTNLFYQPRQVQLGFRVSY